MEGFGWYTYEISRRLAKNHPEHTFYFFFDRPYDPQFVFEPNVIPVVLFPQARHPFLFVLYFEYSITKALKKYKIDLFFSPDGYLSLRTKVPQIAVIHDLNFEHYPNDLPKLASNYLRYYFPKFAKKASHILTVSNHSKQDIAATYSISEEKITAIWNSASEMYKPLTEELKITVREKYSKGNPYFLFVGSLHPRKNVERLLSAFSLLHKRGLTDINFDLVIVGNSMWKGVSYESMVPDNIKNRVRFVGYQPLDNLAEIVGAASLLTYVPYFEGFGIPLVEAMKCGVPLLTSNASCLPEIAGEAALYCDPFDVESIAVQMQKFIQNENLQMDLQKISLERGRLFSWDVSAEKVWEQLQKFI
jgi:glycosyltransferase involved in cell wall biosynthesis